MQGNQTNFYQSTKHNITAALTCTANIIENENTYQTFAAAVLHTGKRERKGEGENYPITNRPRKITW